jgi:hypothetical protein
MPNGYFTIQYKSSDEYWIRWVKRSRGVGARKQWWALLGACDMTLFSAGVPRHICRALKERGMRLRILGVINQTDRADLPGNEARNNNKITPTMNKVKYAFCKVDRIQKSAMTAIGVDG